MKDGKDLSVFTVVMKTIKLDKESPVAKQFGTMKARFAELVDELTVL